MNMEQARFNMIEQQIRPWNVFNEKVLELLSDVKREDFVAKEYRHLAFSDIELPTFDKQTMLCPKYEAKLLEAADIKPTDKVLEIGTGSGYLTALIAKMAEFVYSSDVNPKALEMAKKNLQHAKIKNVSLVETSGVLGLKSKAPFNKIIIGGGLDVISKTLLEQLADGGKLVGFEGIAPVMKAVVIEKIAGKYHKKALFETNIAMLEIPVQKKFVF